MRIRNAVIAAAMLGLVACGKSGGSSSSSSSGTTGTTATTATTTATTTTGTSGTHASSTSASSSSGGSSSGTVGGSSNSSGSSGTSAGPGSTGGPGGSTGGSTGGSIGGSTGASTGGTTGGPPPANDTCTGAIALTKGTSVNGDTTNATDDYTSTSSNTCTTYDTAGHDVVYSFTPAASGRYKITLTPNDGQDASLEVVDTCPAAPIDTCTGGSDKGGSGAAETVTVALTQGTTYLVIVDGYSDTDNGTFSLVVDDAPPLPANDTCAAAEALTVTSGTATASGDTTDTTNDGTTVCGGAFGPDLYYSLHLAADSHVTAVVSTTDANFTPVIALRSSCTDPDGGSNELTCAAFDGTTDATIDLPNVAAGDYLIAIDGLNGSFGAFTLNVTVGAAIPPPANDTCAAAIALDTDGGTATVTGDTTYALSDNASAVCGGQLSPDLYYALTLDADSRVVITATGEDGGTLAPYVSVLAGCSTDGGSTEIVCGAAPTGGDAVDIPLLAAGSYVLAVDGLDVSSAATKGPFTLTVAVSAPAAAPSNDTCATATALTPAHVGDTQTVTGTTVGARYDYSSQVCLGAGGDVFYQLDLTEAAHLTATLTPPDGGSVVAVLDLLEGCTLADGGTPPSETTCADSQDLGAPASLDVRNLQPGSYRLVVDNLIANASSFDLTVSLAAPIVPPSNDTCSAPIPLTLSALPDGGSYARVTFDNSTASNDTHTDTNGDCFGVGQGGDIVYQLVLPGAVPSVTATVTPDVDGGLEGNALVYIRGEPCFTSFDDGGATELACGDSAPAATGAVDGGTLFIWVDSYGGTQGTGVLEVTVP